MKHFSYFIIKPDGIRYMDKIMKEMESRKFSSMCFFAIHDFEEIIKKLYYKHYNEKGEKFRRGFDSYLYGVKQIYNNFAILLVVGEKDRSYEELVKQVFDVKMSIREKYGNNNIGIATNIQAGEENDIRIVSRSGKIEKIRCLNNSGYHRINDLNVIHCPDAEISTTLKELEILYDNGIISDENLISNDMIK